MEAWPKQRSLRHVLTWLSIQGLPIVTSEPRVASIEPAAGTAVKGRAMQSFEGAPQAVLYIPPSKHPCHLEPGRLSDG